MIDYRKLSFVEQWSIDEIVHNKLHSILENNTDIGVFKEESILTLVQEGMLCCNCFQHKYNCSCTGKNID